MKPLITATSPRNGMSKEIFKGKTYFIWPSNPRKMKHRARYCQPCYVDKNGMVIARFLDTRRRGKVDPADLSEVRLPLSFNQPSEHKNRSRSQL